MVACLRNLADEVKSVTRLKTVIYSNGWVSNCLTDPFSLVLMPLGALIAIAVWLFSTNHTIWIAVIEFFGEPWDTQGTIDILFLVITIFIAIVLLGLLFPFFIMPMGAVFSCIRCLLDFVFSPRIKHSVRVIHKSYSPEHTVNYMRYCGGSIWIPDSYQSPATYHLFIDIRAVNSCFPVGKYFYNSVSIGDEIDATSVVGRLSKQTFVQTVGKR